MTPFWKWLFAGSFRGTGLRRFIDWWLPVHLLMGLLVSYLSPVPLAVAATNLLVPIAAIFVGLAFAWGATAQALLQTQEVEVVASHREGGIVEYVYTFQAAILVVLATLVAWGLAGLRLTESWLPSTEGRPPPLIAGTMLFGLTSMMLRECWQIVLATQELLLIRFRVRKHESTLRHEQQEKSR